MSSEVYSLSPFLTVTVFLGGLALTALILFLILRSGKSIKSSDGSLFSSKDACEAYEAILSRLSFIYDPEVSTEAVSLKPEFMALLKNEGFSEPRKLILYKEDFKILVNLLFEVNA